MLLPGGMFVRQATPLQETSINRRPSLTSTTPTPGKSCHWIIYFRRLFSLYVRIKYSNQKRKFQSSPTWESLWYVKNTNVTSVNFRRLTNGSSDLKQSWTPLHVIWSVLNVCSSNQFLKGQNFYTVNEKLLINVFWATVLRQIFVHCDRFSSTFAAFPRPSCYIRGYATRNR